MTSPPAIRVAGAADVDVLLDLVHSAYRGPSGRTGWTSEADLIDGTRITRDQLAADVADPAVTVLLTADAGGCAAVTLSGGAGASFGLFAVRPEGQRVGTGKALLAAAEEHARGRGATVMEMCVIDRRTELIDWYLRRGYRSSGRTRPFPYGAEGVGVPRYDDLRFVVLVKEL